MGIFVSEENNNEYKNNEEYFSNTLSDIDIEIECPNGHRISDSIYYEGIVEKNDRQMGAEIHHVWKNEEITCPKCNEEMTVELGVWEYPEGMLNHADFDDSDKNISILNKKSISERVGIDIE
jgi:hypothetical protein